MLKPDITSAAEPALEAQEELACRLTVAMRLLHGRDAAAHVYLTFRRSGLLVELLDVPVNDDARNAVTLTLRDVDARGLGLTPADFADGVAVCHDGLDGRVPHWSCEPVLIAGCDDQGTVSLILEEPDAERWLA